MPTSLPVLLGILPEYPTVSQTLLFQLNGLIVVFLTLGSVWLALSVLGLVFRYVGATAVKTPEAPRAGAVVPAAAPAPSAAAATPAAPTPELLAAIAAAVYATLGSGYRITSITTAPVDPDWAREGRRQIFASHRVR